MIAKWLTAGVTLFLGLTSLTSTRARADVMYTYTGADFNYAVAPYKKSDSISGSIILAAPIPDSFSGYVSPISFTFTDGVDTLNQTNSAGDFYLTVNADGSIGNIWNVGIFASGIEIETQGVTKTSGIDEVIAADEVPASAPQSHVGTWTETPVPEPNTLYVLGSGLLGLVTLGRQRRFRGRNQ